MNLKYIIIFAAVAVAAFLIWQKVSETSKPKTKKSDNTDSDKQQADFDIEQRPPEK